MIFITLLNHWIFLIGILTSRFRDQPIKPNDHCQKLSELTSLESNRRQTAELSNSSQVGKSRNNEKHCWNSTKALRIGSSLRMKVDLQLPLSNFMQLINKKIGSETSGMFTRITICVTFSFHLHCKRIKVFEILYCTVSNTPFVFFNTFESDNGIVGWLYPKCIKLLWVSLLYDESLKFVLEIIELRILC